MLKTIRKAAQLPRLARAALDRHAERHRPSGFCFAISQCIDAFNAEHWDSIADGARGTVFLSRGFLRAMETVAPANVSGRYALIYEGDVPVAIVAAQLVNLDGAQLVGEKAKTSTAKTAAAGKEQMGVREKLSRAAIPLAPLTPVLLAPRTAPAVLLPKAAKLMKSSAKHAAKSAVGKTATRLRARTLVLGNMMTWGFHGVAFAADRDAREIWPGVLEALYRIRRAERLSGQTDVVMIKDVTEVQAASADAPLRTFSFRPLETEPNMVLILEPTWKTFEDYLGALNSTYRKSTRKVMQEFDNAGLRLERIETAGELRAIAPRIHELYLEVQSNASCRPVTLGADFIPTVAEALGPENFRCTVIRGKDATEIMGFVTSIRDGENSVGYLIGFDRGAAERLKAALYLRLMQTTVADAIDWRCRRLSLGRTALEPKARLGAKPEPTSVWLRHRHPWINAVVRELLDCVPHNEAPERNPFK